MKKASAKKKTAKKKALPKKALEKMIRLDTLKPNPKNPRALTKDAFENLQESIKRDPDFMKFRPIVYDEGRVILGGNQRYRAIQALGMEEIPVEWTRDGSGLSKAQKKRFILVDNAPKGMSGLWDFDVLANEWEVGELNLVGFELSDFDVPSPGDADPGNEPSNKKELACPACGHTWSK